MILLQLVGDSIANPPGMTTPYLGLGQVVKGTSSFVDPITGKPNTDTKRFIVSGIMQPSGNN